jgi:hypothetical protein
MQRNVIMHPAPTATGSKARDRGGVFVRMAIE